MAEDRNIINRFMNTVYYMLDTPVTYFRERFVVPNQKKYPWYHQKFRRVPSIDECYTDDIICYTEANQQFLREKLVDDQILFILRSRFEHCCWYNTPDVHLCEPLRQTYEDAATNWFTRYGDMGIGINVKTAFMKQKHRMIWERRHGPVGSGMKTQATNNE